MQGYKKSSVLFIFCSFALIAQAFFIHFFVGQKIAEAQVAAQTATLNTTATAEELRQKIEQQSKNIEALNREIQAYSELKDKTTAEAKSLQSLIKELDKNAKVLDLDIKKTKTQIERASLEITQIGQTIKTTEQKVSEFKNSILINLQIGRAHV